MNARVSSTGSAVSGGTCSSSSGRLRPNRHRMVSRRNTVGRGNRDEPDAAMDWKDSVAIIESDDGVEAGMVEEVTSERRTTAVRHGAGREDEADATIPFCQLQRAFDEELIPVDMGARLDAIDA